MFYNKSGFLIFTLIILLCEHCSDAANVDDVLTVFNGEGEHKGFIETKGKSTQGNGFSFCSWLKLQGDGQIIFQAKNYADSNIVLRVLVNMNAIAIYGVTGNEHEQEAMIVKDYNLKNIRSWFHLCVVLNQTSINFFLNSFPAENYIRKENVSAVEMDNLSVRIGAVEPKENFGSFFQTNIFDRVVTAEEAKEMYNCKFIEGDFVKWTDITSSSSKFKFGKNIALKEDEIPCPTPPPYNRVNSTTGGPLQNPGENTVPGSTLGNIDPSLENPQPESNQGNMYPESTSQNLDQELSGNSGNSYPGSSSGNSYPGSSAGNSDQELGSGNPYPESSSGNSDPGSSSGNSYPGSSSENSDQGLGSGSPYPGSSLGNSYPGSSSGNSDQELGSGNSHPGSSSENSDQGLDSGSPYPGSSLGNSYPGSSSGNSDPGSSSGISDQGQGSGNTD